MTSQKKATPDFEYASTSHIIIKKRPLTLMEVLIAFALVVMCLLPLIYPHVYILKSEREFVDTIELDHAVNLLYGNRLQKLYLNEIGWDQIEEEQRLPITEAMMKESGINREFPYNGEYQFSIIKRKPPKPDDTLYLVRLVFLFTSKNKTKKVLDSKEASERAKTLAYEYNLFIERRPKNIKEEEKKEEQKGKGEKS